MLNPVAFKAKFGFEKPQKNQEIVVYCRSGKRSATSADIAMRHGYTKYVISLRTRTKDSIRSCSVYNYEGSWLDWTSREQKQ